MVDEKGQLMNFIAVKEDITEKKKMFEEIVASKEKAEEMNRLKTMFLANMSHEVRTPLIGILGYAEMIIEDSKDPELKEKAGVIYKSGKKLNETLDAILDLSKIEADKIDMELEKFSLTEVIEESVILYKTFAEDKHLTINFAAGTNGLLVELDKKMLTKILNNLLSNAIKYTNEGGITISTTYNYGRINIEVEDTGIGIPDDKIDLIFKPFRQVSEGYNRKFEGTGLGLTITKMLVEKMNGIIYLESKFGMGSKFTVEFPVQLDLQDKNFITESGVRIKWKQNLIPKKAGCFLWRMMKLMPG